MANIFEFRISDDTQINIFHPVLTTAMVTDRAGRPPWLEDCTEVNFVRTTLAAVDPFQPFMDPWKRDICAGGLTSYSARLNEIDSLLDWPVTQ